MVNIYCSAIYDSFSDKLREIGEIFKKIGGNVEGLTRGWSSYNFEV